VADSETRLADASEFQGLIAQSGPEPRGGIDARESIPNGMRTADGAAEKPTTRQKIIGAKPESGKTERSGRWDESRGRRRKEVIGISGGIPKDRRPRCWPKKPTKPKNRRADGRTGEGGAEIKQETWCTRQELNLEPADP
jgi:hypothetical protein